jgi:hypothetical protein
MMRGKDCEIEVVCPILQNIVLIDNLYVVSCIKCSLVRVCNTLRNPRQLVEVHVETTQNWLTYGWI